jgi:hypothetical protein
MATYLQGVTDYVPQFQPYQPDLNLYSNVLQTKQTQYDTAWKSLNNIYGQYFYSDLSRDSNIERKDEILKNVDFNLKRVSSLDLSLDQNVNQAVQVFKPFYEDQFIMKDMAWTKNYNNQRGRAEGFKNSDDEKNRAQYWETGTRAMDYMRDEFRKASDDESLSFRNAEYTPYVNVQEKALKITKDAGLSVESIEFSQDGRWIVKNTNGEQLIEPLSKLFEAQLGADPSVQAVYQTQAYVNRKDYAYSNAAQFGGDENAAEMKYLESSFNILKEQNQQRFNSLQIQSTAYGSKIDDIKKQIANGTATPKAKLALAQYEQAKQINDSVLSRVESENRVLNGDQTNATATTSGFINPYGDLKSLRYKVDTGMASSLMQKDLDEAAEIFAYRGAKVNMEANPFAIKAEEHAYRMQEASLRGQYMLKATEMRNKNDKEINLDNELVSRGTHRRDTEKFLPDGSANPNYGRAIPIAAFETVLTEPDTEGGVTDKFNAKEMDAIVNRVQAENIALPQFNNTVDLMRSLIDKKQMTVQEANKILGMDIRTFSKQINKSPTWFLTRQLGDKKLMGINNKLNSWITENSELSGLDSPEYAALKKSSIAFDQYNSYVKQSQEWKRTTSIEVEKDLAKQGFKYAYLLYDNDGNIRTKEQFYAALPKEANKYWQPGRISEKADYETAPPTQAELISGASRSPYTRTPGQFSSELDYDNLKQAAAQVYTSGKISAGVIGLDKIGVKQVGTGKFAMGRSTTFVNPKGYDTKSMVLYGEALRDLQKFDWENTDKNRVTFTGTSKTDWNGPFSDKVEQGDWAAKRNEIARSIVSLMQKEVNNPNTKMGNFKLQVAPIAIGDVKKSAIVITPDSEWLKGLVYNVTDKGKKTGTGIISSDMYDYITQNGLSFIMDSDQMSNTMYKNAYSSPLKATIDATGSYSYTDPLNADRNLMIVPNQYGRGGYEVSAKYPIWNSETNRMELGEVSTDTEDPDGAFDYLLDYYDQNQQALRNYQTK